MKGSNSNFNHASDAKRAIMIIDGTDFVAKKIFLLQRELKILNGWMKVMIDSYGTMINPEEWSDSKQALTGAADLLTDAIVQNAQLLKQLKDEPVTVQRTQLPSTLQ